MFDKEAEIFSETEWSELSALLSLSSRQDQIVRCLLQDMKEPEIARKLNIALPTVRSHMRAIFRKLGEGSRLGVVLRVVLTFLQQCRHSI